MIDMRLVRDVQKAEGCRLTAYRDSLGFWTCGWGHLLVPTTQDWTGETCTQDQADTWLGQDLEAAQSDAEGLPEWPSLDTDCRKNAVVELVFNLGVAKWEKFVNTRDALKLQNWASAAAQLLESRWAAQVGATRSQRLHDYILNGVYP